MTDTRYTHSSLDELNKRNEEKLRKFMANINRTDWNKIINEATNAAMKRESKKRAFGYATIATIAGAIYWFTR